MREGFELLQGPVTTLFHLCTPCNPEECPAFSSSERIAGSGGPFAHKHEKRNKVFIDEYVTENMTGTIGQYIVSASSSCGIKVTKPPQ